MQEMGVFIIDVRDGMRSVPVIDRKWPQGRSLMTS